MFWILAEVRTPIWFCSGHNLLKTSWLAEDGFIDFSFLCVRGISARDDKDTLLTKGRYYLFPQDRANHG